MANSFEYQVLRDTNQKAVIKITGAFDGSGQESNVVRIQANSLFGALDANGAVLGTGASLSNTALSSYGLSVLKMNYIVNMPTPGYVKLAWNGSTPGTIANLNRDGQFGEDQGMCAITNNAANGTGDISVSTFGAAANSSYTIIIELRKDNATYSRGQDRDPAAFNAGNYGIRP